MAEEAWAAALAPAEPGAAEPGAARFRGAVSRTGAKFGFIDCPEVAALCSDDVFCAAAELQGLRAGDAVTFDLRLTETGRPQGQNVARIGEEPRAPASGGSCLGTVKTFAGKIAFIDCPQVTLTHGMDVFCPAAALQGLEVGDCVEFDLAFNAKGQPQARNAMPKGSGKGGSVQASTEGRGASATFGTISWIGDKFGFIDCPPVKAEHGLDTFVPRAALAAFKLGDVVDFDLRFNAKGQPQASNVRPHGGGGTGWAGEAEGAGSFWGGKGGDLSPGWGGKGGDLSTGWGGKGGDLSTGWGGKGGDLSTGWGGKGGDLSTGWGGKGGDLSTGWGGKGGDLSTGWAGKGGDASPGWGSKGGDASPGWGGMGGDLSTGWTGKGGDASPGWVGKGGDASPGWGGMGGDLTTGWAGKGGEAGEGGGSTKYGTITSMGSKFGFIDCPPVKALYGLDTFVPLSGLAGFSVGDVVDFDLCMSEKGQPQAANVRSHGGGGLKRKFEY